MSTRHAVVSLLLLSSPRLWADDRAGQRQDGIIVSVRETTQSSNYVGDTPSDAPLQPEVHFFDVTVRVNCEEYLGHYNSAFDYLREVLTSGREVEVRFGKHVLVVIPRGEDAFTMALTGNRHVISRTCLSMKAISENQNQVRTQ